MNLLRRAWHPRLVRLSAAKGVEGRDESGHDEQKLNRALSPLNRNRTFRFPAHLAEKSHYFAFALRQNTNAIPYLLNRKVKL